MQLASAASAADRADPRHAQAQRLVAEGRCPAALELLAQLRRADPNDVPTLLRIGRCELIQKNYEAAFEALSASGWCSSSRPR